MAQVPAVSSSPIAVMDVVSGTQLSLPLSAVYFEAGEVKAKGNLYTANKAVFDAFLKHLTTTGVVKAGAPAPTSPAMVISAKRGGAKGNFIQVQFKNFGSGANPKFDATVTETNNYPNLTPETVQGVLGSSASTGSAAGLVFVAGAAPTELPKAGTYALAMDGAAASVEIPKNAGAGAAFKLQARTDGADGALIKVTISNVDTTKKTFTLEAVWTKSAAAKIAPEDIGTTFAYAIDVAPPEGGALRTPQAGTTTLGGGADAAEARKASAVVQG